MKPFLVLAAMLAALTVTACDRIPGLSAPPTPTRLPTPVPTATQTTPPAATATTAPTATPTAAPSPTLGSPSDVVSNAFKAMAGVKSFRVKMTSTGIPGVINKEMTIEVVMPDRFHLTGPNTDIVLIGKTVYMKVGTKWSKVASMKGFDLSGADPSKLQANLKTSADFKIIGTDVVNDTPTYVLQYTTNIKGPPAQKILTKVWVGIKDGLPYQSETRPKAGQDITMTFYDYNANISINAPI
ncbi:MAG: hypothetical protein M1570_10215 [Chloroflexi bacterium]|nr:hypothetical protein [Chloroflexota bacterium]